MLGHVLEWDLGCTCTWG